jgi:mRNA interferase YafQ
MVKPYLATSSPEFLEDMARLEAQGYDMSKLTKVMEMLAYRKILPQKYNNHKLKGRWKDCYGPHISDDPDWILIYRYASSDTILFERTGSHRELYPRGVNRREK